jgi:pyridoxal 5'-phosphate synthase pdxT subunit
MKIGVLALQGDFAAHGRAIEQAGALALEVKSASELERIDGLIIPGGESTTMLKLIKDEDLGDSIRAFARSNKPVFGTCAGAILLASEVRNPEQESLGLIDISVERNAYGRQVNSFIGELELSPGAQPLEAVFIRAPRIKNTGPAVKTLAEFQREPVLVRQGNILAATFHPELTKDVRIHRLFIEMVEEANHSSLLV